MNGMKVRKQEIFQYKGERNENYHANAYVLKCMRVALGVYFVAWFLDVIGVFIVDLQVMNTGLFSTVGFCVLGYAYAWIVGIDRPRDKFFIMFFLIAMASGMFMMLAYHATMFMMFPMICSMQYFNKKFTYYTFGMTCLGFAVAVFGGFLFGLCDSNMLLLTYTKTAYYKEILPAGDFTLNNNYFLIFLFFVFPRWLVLWIMIPLQNHLTREIQNRAARETRAQHLAETDGLTQIYNRTKYDAMVSTHYPSVPKVGVVYFDINNLKKLNDSRGHEYGDILICGLANELQALQSDTVLPYRLGGDEFILICEMEDEAEFEKMAMELELKLTLKPLTEEVQLSCAVGHASGEGKDIVQIIRRADEEMYHRKEEMKRV